jgi:chromatin structure-remodeling complex subunit SFH1
MWNLNEMLIQPETFAGIFCKDLDIPKLWADTIAAQIRTQLEEHEGVAAMDLGMDGALNVDAPSPNGEESPECRVILSVSSLIVASYRFTLTFASRSMFK